MPSHPNAADLPALLAILCDAGIEFIVVGGAAAVLHSESFVDEGRQLRVLDLPTLIQVKAKAGRPKDRLMLPVLIATLQEREKLGK